MFTSNKRKLKFYSIMTLSSALIGFVYEVFSHGVYSPYMYLMFLIPLILGVVPICICMGGSSPGKKFFSNKLSYAVYTLGILTLLVGSFLKGVLDIYGTTSPLLTVYLALGIPMMLCAIMMQLSRSTLHGKNEIAIREE
ncbi:MAG: hypothetical protein PUK21_03015 [Peptostreptococcaceae bacterium]|nr:hypothetical protein [Peptostreptococcaceae bacterium]MDY5739532.1 hypothetical protein [Anaerovoracaceae bacterium]